MATPARRALNPRAAGRPLLSPPGGV